MAVIRILSGALQPHCDLACVITVQNSNAGPQEGIHQGLVEGTAYQLWRLLALYICRDKVCYLAPAQRTGLHIAAILAHGDSGMHGKVCTLVYPASSWAD